MMSNEATPTDRAARERLREQQRQEAERLADVLASQRQLVAEQQRAAAAIERAQRKVAARQAAVDQKVVALIDTSGIARAAILLGSPERDLTRLHRAHPTRGRTATAGSDASGDGGPVVPA